MIRIPCPNFLFESEITFSRNEFNYSVKICIHSWCLFAGVGVEVAVGRLNLTFYCDNKPSHISVIIFNHR